MISPLSARISLFLQPISSGPHPSPRCLGDTATRHILTHLGIGTYGDIRSQTHLLMADVVKNVKPWVNLVSLKQRWIKGLVSFFWQIIGVKDKCDHFDFVFWSIHQLPWHVLFLYLSCIIYITIYPLIISSCNHPPAHPPIHPSIQPVILLWLSKCGHSLSLTLRNQFCAFVIYICHERLML